MKKFFLSLALIGCSLSAIAQNNILKITAIPAEAQIYVNGRRVGFGYGETLAPKRNDALAIRIECEGYKPIDAKFDGRDKRRAISYTLQPDGFLMGTVASGVVNKFMTVNLNEEYYAIRDNGYVDVSKAWKKIHEILLNYFEEIATTDLDGGYIQTPWHFKKFNFTNKIIRTRVVVRDISTQSKPAFQIKVSSEVGMSYGAKYSEMESINRIAKELEPMLQELQTRLGKVHNL